MSTLFTRGTRLLCCLFRAGLAQHVRVECLTLASLAPAPWGLASADAVQGRVGLVVVSVLFRRGALHSHCIEHTGVLIYFNKGFHVKHHSCLV